MTSTVTLGDFARRGFDNPSAALRVWQRWEAREGTAPAVPLAAFDVAANRDQALDCLERMAETHAGLVAEMVAQDAWLRRVVAVAGASAPLARYLSRYPDRTHSLATEPAWRDAAEWREHFAEPAEDLREGMAALRRNNYAALLQVAARDVLADEPQQIVAQVSLQLSHIADGIVQQAYQLAQLEVPDCRSVRFAVIALGKTGAQELNYVSDVDVLYVCEPLHCGTAEAMRIGADLAASMSRICSEHTTEGTIWPLDAGLRPEGHAGPLVRTVSSYQSYYAKWAKNWEFQALMKARPVAGDEQLGQEFCRLVEPLVWQAGERPNFVPEARAMRQRVISLVPAKHAERDIKLGAGGLRDTEFSVQLLQLVHGRADERLRCRGTFDGLAALVDHGYIGRADGAELGEAYRWQRCLEHRVQLRALRRDHIVPDEPALTHVARGLRMSPADVIRRWRSSFLLVSRLQERLFFSPLLDAVSNVTTQELKLSTQAATTRLKAIGFADPRSALKHIQALTTGSSRTAEIQRQLMPAMLGWFAEGANPDFGLLAFRQLSDDLGQSSWYLRALRDEGYMAQRLAYVASTSRYVVSLLRRAPAMVQMLAKDAELQPRSHETLRQNMVAAMARHSDPQQAAASLRALRRFELCRIGLSDVLGQVELDVAGRALSDVASATIDAAIELARREIDAPPLGVIALGRWGGKEMSYGSDVDAMVVVPDDVSDQQMRAAGQVLRRVQEIIGAPGPEPALVMDTDLRPEGRDGAAVRTVSSYRMYYEQWASTWEAQALLRARPGAGEQELCRLVLDDVADLRYPPGGVTASQVTEIRRLKSRMEAERLPRRRRGATNVKLGSGGLVDVEWTVQLLQLRHAHEHPQLRTTGTVEALAGLRELNLLGENHHRVLRRAWQQASELRNAIMLARGRASDELPSDYRELSIVAQLLGYAPNAWGQLADDTARYLRRAAAVCEELFWES